MGGGSSHSPFYSAQFPLVTGLPTTCSLTPRKDPSLSERTQGCAASQGLSKTKVNKN